MNPGEDKVIRALTSYRLIPAMYRALTAEGKTFYNAAEELANIFGIKPELVEPLLEPFKSRIVYAMQDFRHYADLVQPPTFIDSYWPAMEEEASLVKDTAPFATDVEHASILDIGSGPMPYLKYFKRENKELSSYFGIDKNYKETFNPPALGVIVNFAPMTWEKAFATCNFTHEVLFLGNFLHCLEDIENFFEIVLHNMKDLKIIKILEPKPNTSMDFLLDYHMFEHCGGQCITPEYLRKLNTFKSDIVHMESLGDYHNMYTILR